MINFLGEYILECKYETNDVNEKLIKTYIFYNSSKIQGPLFECWN